MPEDDYDQILASMYRQKGVPLGAIAPDLREIVREIISNNRPSGEMFARFLASLAVQGYSVVKATDEVN